MVNGCKRNSLEAGGLLFEGVGVQLGTVET